MVFYVQLCSAAEIYLVTDGSAKQCSYQETDSRVGRQWGAVVVATQWRQVLGWVGWEGLEFGYSLIFAGLRAKRHTLCADIMICARLLGIQNINLSPTHHHKVDIRGGLGLDRSDHGD